MMALKQTSMFSRSARSPCFGSMGAAGAGAVLKRGISSHTSRNRSRMQVQAVLDSSVAEAVTQQATAFAIVLAGEAAFSRSNIPESDKGRPGIPQVAAGVVGSLLAAALIGQGGGAIPTAGVVAGFLVSAYMLFYNVRRTLDLEYNDGDWPGPKAWPAGMSLISFFALSVFFQALVADISTIA